MRASIAGNRSRSCFNGATSSSPASSSCDPRFVWALDSRNLAEARNLAFSVLIFGELFRAFAARSTTRTFWEVGAFTNARLLCVVLLSFFLQLGIHHIPATQTLFEIGTISLGDCALGVLVGLCPVTVIEVQELIRRAKPIPARQPG